MVEMNSLGSVDNMSISLFHALEGENIYFKSLSTNDAQEIHIFASDEEVSRFIGWSLMITLSVTSEHIETMVKHELAGTH